MARDRSWDDPWRRFPPSIPLPVADGLATSRQRGEMAGTWWSKRFVEVLESYGLGTRLQRGRRYARQGQILTLDISAGLLTAQVQGSRRTPYVVTVSVRPPTDRQWRVVDRALRGRVGLAANLLAGEVPPELEEVFSAAKAPLFPDRWQDLAARCSCPDVANPCKHIAATLYVFADRLDADPWLLLEWRGRSRDQVLAALGLDARRDEGAEVAPWWPLRPGEPLRDDDDVDAAGPAIAPDPPFAVLRRMDDLDVQAWRAPVEQTLHSLYAAVLDRD